MTMRGMKPEKAGLSAAAETGTVTPQNECPFQINGNVTKEARQIGRRRAYTHVLRAFAEAGTESALIWRRNKEKLCVEK